MPVPQVLLGVAAIAADKVVEMAKDPKVQAAVKDVAKKAWDNKDEIKDAAAPVVRKAVKKGAAAGSKAAGFVGDTASNVAKAAERYRFGRGSDEGVCGKACSAKGTRRGSPTVAAKRHGENEGRRFRGGMGKSAAGGFHAPLEKPGLFRRRRL